MYDTRCRLRKHQPKGGRDTEGSVPLGSSLSGVGSFVVSGDTFARSLTHDSVPVTSLKEFTARPGVFFYHYTQSEQEKSILTNTHVSEALKSRDTDEE